MSKTKKYRTKGDLMKAVYTEDELQNIDSAIPIHLWDDHPTFNHVMNYNEPHRQGRLENMFEVADKRGIRLEHVSHV